MLQDPKKKEVGEMGKPSLKAKFEAAMQKERDFVLNRAKKREEGKERLTRMVKDVKEEGGKEKLGRFVKDVKEVKAPLKKKYSLMMSMNKLD